MQFDKHVELQVNRCWQKESAFLVGERNRELRKKEEKGFVIMTPKAYEYIDTSTNALSVSLQPNRRFNSAANCPQRICILNRIEHRTPKKGAHTHTSRDQCFCVHRFDAGTKAIIYEPSFKRVLHIVAMQPTTFHDTTLESNAIPFLHRAQILISNEITTTHTQNAEANEKK